MNDVAKSRKIFITGTGRCGTTFLIILFTYLNMDTGYTPDNFIKFIERNGCNSGMEKNFKEKPYILKDPRSINQFDDILKIIVPDCVIIPIRNYEDCAKSSVRYWRLEKYEDKLEQYYKSISNYVLMMVKHDIPTIFLDFEKMINSKEYLFSELKPVLNEITFNEFSVAYEKATLNQKRK